MPTLSTHFQSSFTNNLMFVISLKIAEHLNLNLLWDWKQAYFSIKINYSIFSTQCHVLERFLPLCSPPTQTTHRQSETYINNHTRIHTREDYVTLAKQLLHSALHLDSKPLDEFHKLKLWLIVLLCKNTAGK